MTREILFRGQRLNSEEWICGDLLQSNGRCAITPQDGYLWSSPNDFEVKPETVGAYANFKDKKGVKAFDGDYDADGNMIHFCEECNGWQFAQIDVPTGDFIHCHCYNCEGNFQFSEHAKDFEIIGNIHETK